MFRRYGIKEGNRMKKERIARKSIHVILIAAMIFTAVIPTALPSSAATPKLQATAYVRVKKGAVLRRSANAKGKVIKKLKYNSKLRIYRETFTSKTSTKAKTRWYYVAYGSKKGYIRSDMVKNIKYTAKKAYTTDYLYYRVGVGKKMKRKGMFNKGASVNVLIPAYQKGSKEKWYKVKVGKNYYYSCATWIKLGTAKKKSSTKSKSTPVYTPSVSSAVGRTISGYNYPTVLGIGCPFSIRGKIKSGEIIESGSVAIEKENGTNAIYVEKELNKNMFNISDADAEVKFGTLAAGKYKYRVAIRVDGKSYNMLTQKFSVVSSKKAKHITNKAFELAWSANTATRKSDYGPGKPTAAYKKALSQVYPDRSSWGAAPRAGASCDVFVGTVLRASGMDTSVPRGLDEQYRYFAKSKKWERIKYTGDRSVLQSGDVIILDRGNGSHIFLYVTQDSREYLAEAGYRQFYGRISTGADYSLRINGKRKYYVYRIVE